MADKVVDATNKERVARYHKKLSDIKIRVPSVEVCYVDYVSMFKARAAQKGTSLNNYILDLIEKDLQQDNPDFKIQRGVTKD